MVRVRVEVRAGGEVVKVFPALLYRDADFSLLAAYVLLLCDVKIDGLRAPSLAELSLSETPSGLPWNALLVASGAHSEAGTWYDHRRRKMLSELMGIDSTRRAYHS